MVTYEVGSLDSRSVAGRVYSRLEKEVEEYFYMFLHALHARERLDRRGGGAEG